ncbi:MAG: Fic family protein [Christensenellales bacterium]
MGNRAGEYATNLMGEAAYRSFIPSPLPPDPPIALSDGMLRLLVKAHGSLALLNGLAARIPSMALFVSMYVRKEALLSSQIEGTQATLEDVLDPMSEHNTNQNVVDVVNYVKAAEYAIERMNTLPLSNRLIREAHGILMEGVRGQEKSPGEFRVSQNWIGGQGSAFRNARYIPPNPQDMNRAISDLEKYLHAHDNLDVLIRAALIHYQFETIHPFLDGNGRVGRLLVVLYLMSQGALTSPALYISYFLKKNRAEYYDRLSLVRENGSYEQWVQFFLQAFSESAEDALGAIDRLSALHTRNLSLISVMGRAAGSTETVFMYLESHPIIDIRRTAAALNMSFGTAAAAVHRLREAGILRQTNEGAERNRVFAYAAYLDILREGT